MNPHRRYWLRCNKVGARARLQGTVSNSVKPMLCMKAHVIVIIYDSPEVTLRFLTLYNHKPAIAAIAMANTPSGLGVTK